MHQGHLKCFLCSKKLLIGALNPGLCPSLHDVATALYEFGSVLNFGLTNYQGPGTLSGDSQDPKQNVRGLKQTTYAG